MSTSPRKYPGHHSPLLPSSPAATPISPYHMHCPQSSTTPAPTTSSPIPSLPHLTSLTINITILDSSSNILYQTYNSSHVFFHVYNLKSRRHVPIPFPHPYAFVNAAITIDERIHFKVLVVCIERLINPLFGEAGDDNSSNLLVFFIYSSKSKIWSCIQNPSPVLTSNRLLTNRRKPAHTGEDVVYLDLTDLLLIRFASSKDQFDPIPKLISQWERDSLDETTRYAGCCGSLHCVKFNPIETRFEVHLWASEPPNGVWKLEVAGLQRGPRGRSVLGIHPNNVRLVFMRSTANDEILIVDIRNNFQWVVISKRGENCGQVCSLEGWTEVLEVALEGSEKLKPSGCGILHPHENIDGPEGEIFIISFFESSQTSIIICV